VPTLEDKIEAERQQLVEELKLSGKGTKVTPETFAAWQENKRKRRAEEAKKLVEAELRKKKGGKGLAVLSGRALYEYKQDLFNVDENTREERDGDDAAEEENGGGTTDNPQANGGGGLNNDAVEKVASKVQADLFLEGDDDLDDLDDMDDD
jgi:DRG Family Regulatory Proteins, Tma46